MYGPTNNLQYGIIMTTLLLHYARVHTASYRVAISIKQKP